MTFVIFLEQCRVPAHLYVDTTVPMPLRGYRRDERIRYDQMVDGPTRILKGGAHDHIFAVSMVCCRFLAPLSYLLSPVKPTTSDMWPKVYKSTQDDVLLVESLLFSSL